MDIVEHKYLKSVDACANEPNPTKEVGIYDISRRIAKKTKFRVSDIQEVLDEFAPAVFSILAERKTVNLDGIKLKNTWHRFDEPKYIRTNGSRSEDGFWVYGYYLPRIEFCRPFFTMFKGKGTKNSDGVFEKVKSYFPEGMESCEDIGKYIRGFIQETSMTGKELCVDENGYIIYPPGSKKTKKKKFREDFHPTIFGYRNYYYCRNRALFDYKKMSEEEKASVNFLDFLNTRMKEYGYWGKEIEKSEEVDFV